MAELKTSPKKTTKKVPAKKVAVKKTAAKKPARTGSGGAPTKTAVAKPALKKVPTPAVKAEKSGDAYIYAVGRRKTASVQARIYLNTKVDTAVNGRALEKYFGTAARIANVLAPIKAVGMEEKLTFTLLAQGGGISGQSDAAKLALARALVKHDAMLRPALKAAGFLTRDARKVERKKPGLKKARRSPQWAKR